MIHCSEVLICVVLGGMCGTVHHGMPHNTTPGIIEACHLLCPCRIFKVLKSKQLNEVMAIIAGGLVGCVHLWYMYMVHIYGTGTVSCAESVPWWLADSPQQCCHFLSGFKINLPFTCLLFTHPTALQGYKSRHYLAF